MSVSSHLCSSVKIRVQKVFICVLCVTLMMKIDLHEMAPTEMLVEFNIHNENASLVEEL
jgi:hypothetical protein